MKTFTTLFALCVAVTAFAQIEKGRSFITGSASISNRDYKDQDYKTFFTNGFAFRRAVMLSFLLCNLTLFLFYTRSIY